MWNKITIIIVFRRKIKQDVIHYLYVSSGVWRKKCFEGFVEFKVKMRASRKKIIYAVYFKYIELQGGNSREAVL